MNRQLSTATHQTSGRRVRPVILLAALVLLVSQSAAAVPAPGWPATPVDPPCGVLDGALIDDMDEIDGWQASHSPGASVSLPSLVPGHTGQAIQIDYDLGSTTGAYVQLRHDFISPINLSGGDHLRFWYRGTTTNTLEVGLVSKVDDGYLNYFSTPWPNVTHVGWWTYGTWDLQDFRKGDTEPLPNLSQISAIFISVVKSKGDVGGIGSFAVDDIEYVEVATRTVPSDFEPVLIPPAVSQAAAACIAGLQRSGGLLQSWQEDYPAHADRDFAWLYDQALGLLVLADADPARAGHLAAALDGLQNADGSWYNGYHFLTGGPVDTTSRPVGANAWAVYALLRYAQVSGDPVARQAGLRGAAWLAEQQRPDGSLPGEVIASPDPTAPTETVLDAWWAFQAAGYAAQADRAHAFLVSQAWEPAMGRFLSSGSSYPPREKYGIYLDNQTWGAAFLHALGRDDDARRALSFARWTLATLSSDGAVCGLDGSGPFSVWNEGTLQYVAAGGENSTTYAAQVIAQQAPDGCLPGSPEPYTVRAYRVWLTPMHGVVPTAWLYLAGTGGPFRDTHRAWLPLVAK
jgi:hypothetical protein